MTEEQDKEAEEYFAEKKRRENPVPKLEGWEHDCGFFSDSESLFLVHLETCNPAPTPKRKRRHG